VRFELRDGVLHTDGAPGLLATADYPYYRDSPTVWRERLRTLRDATGIRIVSSYLPWRHHQPDPDTPPDFTGATRPDRDVVGYLRICAELGLSVIAKPGPFIHAETNYGGLPDWISPLRDPRVEPQLNAAGEVVRWIGSVPGADGEIEHWPLPAPLGAHFAARTADWLRAVNKEVLEAATGPQGPVVLVQVANEGLFTDGSLPLWAYDYSAPGLALFHSGLRRHYTSLDAYNRLHGTAHTDWTQIEPPREPHPGGPLDVRRQLGYADWGRHQANALAESYHTWTEALSPRVPVVVNLNPPAGEPYALDSWLARVRPESWHDIAYGFTNWMGVVSTDHGSHARYVIASKRAPGPNLEENWGFSELYDRAYAAGATSFHQSLLALAAGATGFNVYTGVATSGWGADLDAKHTPPYPDCPPIDAEGAATGKAGTVRMLADFFAAHGAEFLAAEPVTGASWGLYAPYAAIAAWTGDAAASGAAEGASVGAAGGDPLPGCGRPLRDFHERMRAQGQDYRIVDLESATAERLADHPHLVLHGGAFMHAGVQRLLADQLRAGHRVELLGAVPRLDEELAPCTVLAEALAAAPETAPAEPAVRVLRGSADAYWRTLGPRTGYLTVLLQSDNEGPVAVEIATGAGSRGIEVGIESARGGAAVLRIVDGVLDDFLLTGGNSFLGSSVTPSVSVDGGEVRGTHGQDLARIGGEQRTLVP